MIEPPDDEIEDSPEKQQQLARIARPAPDALQPVVARGLGPATGSTEDLEARGMADHLSPRALTPPPPSPLEARTTADQGELGRLQSTGSGVAQIAKAHPIAGGILRGLNIAGEVAGAVLPSTQLALRAIPGTEQHHQQLIGRQERKIGEDQAEQAAEAANAEKTAQTGLTGAQTGEAEARTKNINSETARAGQPKPKEEEWTVVPGMVGPNGQLVQQEKTSGQIRFAPDISGVGPVNPAAENATVEDQKYENIISRAIQGQPVSPEEKAWAQAYKQRKTLGPVTSAALQQPNKDDARMDKSYQLNQNRLDKTRAPIDQLASRFSQLQDTLKQGTPQADALVSPGAAHCYGGRARIRTADERSGN